MLDFFIVLLCLAINAVFSAYEMAFVTISKNDVADLAQDESLVMQQISSFRKRPERTLSVIQIGITLVGAIAAAVGGSGAVESIEPFLARTYNIGPTLAEALAVTMVIVPLTYFSVVFGELVPKSIALRHPLTVLKLGSRLISLIDTLLTPIVSSLELSTNFILRILHLENSNDQEKLRETIDIGGLPAYHRKFVHNLVSLKSIRIKKIMHPWNKIVHLAFSLTDDEVEDIISHSNHSRFPVIDGDVLVGIFHWKEWDRTAEDTLVPWQSLLAPALKVLEEEKVLEVFLKMQSGNNHLAIVVDAKDQLVGLVSLEDIVESIVGNIKDDLERNRISRLLSHRTKIRF